MALSHKNRRWVVGGLLVGTLGGGPLVLSLINFGGSAAGTTLNQVPKLEPGVVAAAGSAGRTGGALIDSLGPVQDAMTRLNTTTTAAPAAAAATDPDS